MLEICARAGFYPDARQRELLTGRGHRVILNCCRQWGKSTVTAAKAVYQALSRPENRYGRVIYEAGVPAPRGG